MRLFYLICLIGTLICANTDVLAKRSAHYATYKTKMQSSASTYYGAVMLGEEINRLIAENGTRANVGVYVKSMSDGATLYSHNVTQPLTPASTLKILTAEAALIYLGPQYQFNTQLLTDAKGVKNGVLQGNLYIVLSGDPTLTYADIIDLMLSLREQQIQAIAGNVYIDNTAYDQRFYGPGWVGKDKESCYGAPISASIINHNCLAFTVAPNKVSGRPAQVTTYSKYFYPPIKNSVVTKTGRARACSMRLTTEPSSVISIDGCMSKNRYASGISYVVTDVPEYNRSLFKSVLDRIPVRVYGGVTFGSAPRGLSLVANHASEPLPAIINDMLKKSDNIIAGALFKKLGQVYSRQPGSWENGSIAVSAILSRHANVNIAGMRILDGSGLSPYNLATPQQLMQVLDYAYHHQPVGEHFIPALPISGVDGTLKHRMTNIIRRVRAKTGTISGVVSLAGYVMTKNKEPLAFVIIVNGSKGMSWRYKSMEDKIATALTRYVKA